MKLIGLFVATFALGFATTPTAAPTTAAPTQSQPFPFLNVALVNDNMKEDKVVMKDSKSVQNYLENRMFTDLFPYLSAGMTEPKVAVEVKKFFWSPADIVDLQPTLMVDDMPWEGEGAKFDIIHDTAANVFVAYECRDNTKRSRNFTMSLELSFPSLPPPNNGDVTITWTKHCWPGNQPGEKPDGPPDSWTGTQIFFFVVFLLTLVGCLLGCGYNYVLRSRTGIEIIPCIDTFRMCCSKCSGGGGSNSGYQPEMGGGNYQEADGNNQYGAVYNTDL